jgi:hypothetical protein
VLGQLGHAVDDGVHVVSARSADVHEELGSTGRAHILGRRSGSCSCWHRRMLRTVGRRRRRRGAWGGVAQTPQQLANGVDEFEQAAGRCWCERCRGITQRDEQVLDRMREIGDSALLHDARRPLQGVCDPQQLRHQLRRRLRFFQIEHPALELFDQFLRFDPEVPIRIRHAQLLDARARVSSSG